MPCMSGPSHEQQQKTLARHRELSMAEAMLCALLRNKSVLSVVQGEITLGLVDFARAGVAPSEFIDWWTRHQSADRKREKKEAAEATAKQRREEALAKLTPEDRAALGLK